MSDDSDSRPPADSFDDESQESGPQSGSGLDHGSRDRPDHESGLGLRYEGGLDPIRDYFLKIWQILAHPRKFFRKLSLRGGLTEPLVFALVTHWIGAAVLYLWRISYEGIFSQLFRKVSHFSRSFGAIEYLGFGSSPTVAIGDRILHWFWDTSPIVLDPFITLVMILFHSFWVFIGARVFVAPGKDHHPAEISYATATKIVCFGMTPSILNIVPVLGGWSVSFLTVIYTLIGVKEFYRVGSVRALAITLFPKLIFVGILVLGAIFFLGTLAKWALLMFS